MYISWSRTIAAAGKFSLKHKLGEIRGCSASKGLMDRFIDIHRLCRIEVSS